MSNTEDTSPIVPTGWEASTYLNSTIKTYSDIAHRVKLRLGFPTNNVDVSDEAIANHINEAVEMYTRYAGFDTEYVVFCDTMLDAGCEVKLDELVDSCLNSTNSVPTSGLTFETVVSSINVNDILLGSSISLVDFETSISSSESIIVNQTNDSVDVSTLELTYDSSNPWQFKVSDANRVVINPLDTYPLPEIVTPVLDAWVEVSDGLAKVYPPNWEDLDPCVDLQTWWGVSGLSSFDPSSATHLVVTQVPVCTVEGTQTLNINTGRGVTFSVIDKTLDTCGYIEAQVQFVNDFSLPDNLSGGFNVLNSTGFKVTLESHPDQFMNTSGNIPVSADFYQSLSSFEYGLSAVETDNTCFFDNTTNTTRKITDVFFVDPTGQHHGDLLFNFEYAFMQNILGYDGMGSRVRDRGYDLLTYDMSKQFLETIDKYFGGGTIGFQFNKRTQKLRVFKNQRQNCGNGCYLIGVNLEREIEHILPEPWITDYVTALTKITMGNTLTKFAGAETLGGLTINGNDVLTQGIQEKEELLIWLREDNSEGGLDKPVYIY